MAKSRCSADAHAFTYDAGPGNQPNESLSFTAPMRHLLPSSTYWQPIGDKLRQLFGCG
jgi:hypothetical protein